MKFEISHNVFYRALLHGGAATKSKDSQNPELARKQPLLHAVRLTADSEGLVVESSAGGISAKTFVPKDGVAISISGVQCVDVTEMTEDLSKLKFPHTLRFSFDPDQVKADEDLPSRIQVGAVNQKGREAFAWSYDVYPTRGFPKIAYSTATPKFSVEQQAFKNALAAVQFTKRDDDQHILDNVVVGIVDGVLQLGTTDTQRGSIVKITEGVKLNETNGVYLVNWETLDFALNSFDNGEVIDFIFEDGNENLTMRNANGVTNVRLALPDYKFSAKLGKLFGLTDTSKTKYKIEIDDKDELLQATMVMSLRAVVVNYHFPTGEDEIKIEYSSRHRPAMVGCKKITAGPKSAIPLSVKLFLDILQKMSGEHITISIDENESKVYIQDLAVPNFFYLMLRQKNEIAMP